MKADTPRKSILMITRFFPPDPGGTEIYSYGLAFGFSRNGHGVTVIAPETPGFESFDQKQVFPTIRYSWAPPRVLRLLRMYRAAAGILKGETVDFILATGWSPSGIVAYILAKRFRIPYLVVGLGTEISMHRIFRRLMVRIFNSAYLVIAISNFTQDILIKYGINQERIRIVFPGIDENYFHPLNHIPPEIAKLKKGKVLLTVTRLAYKKGVDRVLGALPAVLEEIKDLTYLIIGDGEDRERLEKIVDNLGLKKTVHFIGSIPNEETVYYYNLCDLFIMVSRVEWGGKDFEGFGIVFSEASACAKPVIGGRSGGITDAVVDGRTGILVDPHDEDAIARAIIKLFKSPEIASKMGREGRRRTEQELNWPAIAEKVMDVFIQKSIGKSSR
jgi:phosphatidyl-myo-inositol dimannoside synthase